jgi:Ca-activated chloride channel family protein
MRTYLLTVSLILGLAGISRGQGLLIPVDRTIPPLAQRSHRVRVAIEEQVAVTRVEQTFRNPSPRPLEATYVFPVPPGASVREFAMWVGGKRVDAELVEAAKARRVYTDIVRRTRDPALLEYMGRDLLRMRVFPVPARGDQKVELSYTSLARREGEVVEYVYPLRTDERSLATLEDFTLSVTVKSRQPILNVYSPTHAVSVNRVSDREVIVGFEKEQCRLDKDFQLFYSTGGKDVGLSALAHRPKPGEDGYVLLLISPRAHLYKEHQAPRDVVFVLDTSGSMAEDGKLEQARRALKHCLDGLGKEDRFALVQFATTVNRFDGGLSPATEEHLKKAREWLDGREARGGTAIDEALQTALEMQGSGRGRPFILAFFTDGKPTIGEADPDKILANVGRKNTARTRIFAFGLGDGVNAALLDQLADTTRGVSMYVRPSEDLNRKVTAFFDKMSHPVLVNLKLSAGAGTGLHELYPPKLPDLFHGGQLTVFGRYSGSGPTALTLTGEVDGESRKFVYETDLPARSEGKRFVEDLWARRKVGYLLEQIRLNGEKKELVEEVTALAKRYGIATPYTSYLIVPDTPIPIVPPRPIRPPIWPPPPPPILKPVRRGGEPRTVVEVAREVGGETGGLTRGRFRYEDRRLAALPEEARGDPRIGAMLQAREKKQAYDAARRALKAGTVSKLHSDKLGVELSVRMQDLKNQSLLRQTALRKAAGRNLLEVGGVWIDEGFEARMPVVTVRAMSEAYFRILERHPQVREVFRLGNHLVWVTPSGTALVIDTATGKERLPDAEIDRLFRGS